ncbi:MAG: chromosome segregation protein SMC [Rhodospirillaceae bacterium]
MVAFTRLRLVGFKSFVEPAELLIEPGLTGVVGPNGCGKSNLVEAMRWCMGETSAKQLRGSEMDDVIFGGTANRPSRNVAEVTLGLDNGARKAPTMFNTADELEVIRRIERGSGSAYRVNGKEVRARDVQLLFADSATGARSTAMVSQGKVGALIGAKPAQRRALLEEAAGIGGLHARRHESEQRLRAAEGNLTRLEDVLAALDGQLNGLRRQSRQAQRYRALSEDIRTTEAVVLRQRWLAAIQVLDHARKAFDAVQRTVAERTGVATTAERERDAANAAMQPLRDAEAEAVARLQRLVVAREQIEAEEKRLRQSAQENQLRLEQAGTDLARESERAQDAKAAQDRLRDERARLEEGREGELQAQEAAKEHLLVVNEETRALEQELTRLTREIADLEARTRSLTRESEQATHRTARQEQRLRDVEGRKAALQAETTSADQLEAARQDEARAVTALEDAQAARAAVEQRLAELRSGLDADRDRDRASRAVVTRLEAEAKGLEALLARTGGGGGKGGAAQGGRPVLEALSVAPGWETALAVALGDDLKRGEEAQAGVWWQALPPVTADQAPLPMGVESIAAKVTGPEVLARRLSRIGVVDSVGEGEALMAQLGPGARLVTQAGDLWRWDGFRIRAGTPVAGADAAARLETRNRLAAVSEDLVAARQAAEETGSVLAASEAAARDGAREETAARDRLRQAEGALNKARSARAVLEREAAAAEARLSSAVEAVERAVQDLEEARSQERDAKAALAGLGDGAALRTAAAHQGTELEDARARLVEARAERDRLTREAEDRARRIAAVEADLKSWTDRQGAAEGQITELTRRRDEAAEALAGLAGKPDALAEQRQTLGIEITQAEAQRTEAADALAGGERRRLESDRAAKEAEKALAAAREERVRLEAAVEQGDQSVRAVARETVERMDCAPEALPEKAHLGPDAELPPLEDQEERLRRLNRERDGLGPVNLRAEAEALELEEQINTLRLEQEDLVAAIARLRQGISELNREGRRRLLESFKQVDRHFRDLFTRLFGGGQAHLEMIESDDPLEAGLEIMASPPGKRLQILSLLSGGEQALTATALLFAVFLTNPAPICVLDEVDAPLDDANVDRFCSLLRELTGDTATRFLVVTHHRMTMARMDRLFGVTMAERGVSTLVSVDLKAAAEMVDS